MFTNAKKIVIETESHEVFVVRVNSRSGLRGFCASCGSEQDLLTLDESVSLSKTGALALLDVIRREAIHFLEASGGHILVCKNSLEKWAAGCSTALPSDEIEGQVDPERDDVSLIPAIL